MQEYPIDEFHNDKELNKSLLEWKHRLFLDGWNIKACIVCSDDIPGLAGLSKVQWENSCGVIQLCKKCCLPENVIEKEPMEKTLVHELLHFKIMSFDDAHNNIESLFYETKNHQLLEQIAKSLIMAKYNIDIRWFYK